MAISYTKTNWNNDTDPPINAENLNKIENGIESCVNGVNGALPLSGGTLTGDLSITNYKKLKFTDNSYFQNQANTRTALYGDLKMENGNIILGTGLSINPPADTAVFNGIQIKGNVRLDDGLLYMNGKRIALVATPTTGTDAANKKYVDDQIATIDTSNYVQKSNESGKLYGTDANANPYMYTVSNGVAGNLVVSRKYNGQITLPQTPAIDTDAASKAYVDSVATASGSTYLVQIESNYTQGTVTYGWKIGKMIVFYGTLNDGINTDGNSVTVASGDTISHGFIKCGAQTMPIEATTGRFNLENATLPYEHNFSGVIWLS